MENKDFLHDTRRALKKGSLPTFVEKGDDRGIEDKILDALEYVIVNGKPSERLEASWLFMKYKYGNPANKTDITTAGQSLQPVVVLDMATDTDHEN